MFKTLAYARAFLDHAMFSVAARRIVEPKWKGQQFSQELVNWIDNQDQEMARKKKERWMEEYPPDDEWWGGETTTYPDWHASFNIDNYLDANVVRRIGNELLEKARKAGHTVYMDIDEELREDLAIHDEGERPNLKIRVVLSVEQGGQSIHGFWHSGLNMLKVFIPDWALYEPIFERDYMDVLAHELAHAVSGEVPALKGGNAAIYSIILEFFTNLKQGMTREEAFNTLEKQYQGKDGGILDAYREALMTLPLEEISHMFLQHHSASPIETEADTGWLMMKLQEPENMAHLKEIWSRHTIGEVPDEQAVAEMGAFIEALAISGLSRRPFARFPGQYIKSMAESFAEEFWKEYKRENAETDINIGIQVIDEYYGQNTLKGMWMANQKYKAKNFIRSILESVNLFYLEEDLERIRDAVFQRFEDEAGYKAASLKREASGTTILYHMDKHGPGFPKPLRPHYTRNFDWSEVFGDEPSEQTDYQFRPWMKDPPEKAMWLTPDWSLVYSYQMGVPGPVHVYEVDNGLIEEAGGIHRYDRAPEIVISGDIWERGIQEGKIKYKGKMRERKQRQRQRERQNFRQNWSPGKTHEITDRLADFVLKLHGTEWGEFIKEQIQHMMYYGQNDELQQLVDELERGIEPTIVTEEKIKRKLLEEQRDWLERRRIELGW